MRDGRKTRIENCAYCGGKITTRYGYGGILFFNCPGCGACVSFKNIKHPLRIQVDDPISCFNRRHIKEEQRDGH